MPSAQNGQLRRRAVRRATPGDAPQVARLLHDFQLEYDEPTPDVETLGERYGELIRNREMTVLLVGDGPDGFAQLRFRPWVYSAGLHAYLEELYVVPPLRGQGLGRRLLEAAIEAARARARRTWSWARARQTSLRGASTRAPGSPTVREAPDGPVMYFYEREL